VQIAGEQASEEIRRRVVYERVVTHRPRYVPSCVCAGNPAVRTAPPPPKVIAKGELAPEILASLLVNKFDLSIPLERSLRLFAYEGLYLAKGSVTGMFQSMLPLFEPVYAAMREHLLLAGIWNVDETRWLVFVDHKHKWWMWGAVGPDVVVYVIDPRRNANALHRLLPEQLAGQGIVISDRYVVYGPRSLDPEHYLIQYCWVHLRRDFVRAARADAALKPWSLGWLQRIRTLFHLERQRRYAMAEHSQGSQAYRQADVALRSWVLGIRRTLSAQLNTVASTRAFDVLHAFDERFANYTVFLDHPEVPPDNNAAERALRTPVLGRKNFYGSRAVWAVHQAEVLESIFATLRRNGLSPLAWTLAFLTACAENRGQPLGDITRFLPWRMRDADRRAWALPPELCAQSWGTHRARDGLEQAG
jgi:transposase